MGHIGPYAEELKRREHNTAICLPWIDDTLQYYAHQAVPVLSYSQVLENPKIFDGKPPDILHAWTPREIVRRFCIRFLGEISAKLVIHLEDNEWVVAERARSNPKDRLFKTNPLEGAMFLRMADAVTIIIESLGDQIPDSKPGLVLKPGLDLNWLDSVSTPALTRDIFGVPESYKVLVYTGGSTGANRLDLENLFHAVGELNNRGTPCILIKTGFPDAEIRKKLSDETQQWIRDVGYLDRNMIPRLIRLADCVVQPGKSDLFNRYRLPSKLPEFLCLGMPVITSAVNLGESLIDGLNARLLHHSTPVEIADRCQEIFADPQMSKSIGEAGKEFGRRHFDLQSNSENLLDFYSKLQTYPQNPYFQSRIDSPKNQPAHVLEVLKDDLKRIAFPNESNHRQIHYLKSKSETVSELPTADKRDEVERVELQIYFPNKPEFLEICSIRRHYSPQKSVSFTFPFSPPEELNWLRIDPGQSPGEYYVQGWSLLSADRTPLLSWQNTHPPDPSIAIRAEGSATLKSENSTLSIISSGRDPQVLFSGWPKTDFSKARWLCLTTEAKHIMVQPKQELLEISQNQNWLVEPESKWMEELDEVEKLFKRRQATVRRWCDQLIQFIKG